MSTVSIEMLLAWPALAALLVLLDRRHGPVPLFLCASYIAALAVQHWPGAFAHALPALDTEDAHNTAVGMTYSTLGLAFFVLGAALVPSPMQGIRRLGQAFRIALTPATLKKGHDFARVLLIGGLVAWAAERTSLMGLPSVTSIIAAGKAFLIAGLSLKAWLYWHTGRRLQVHVCIACTVLLPAYTMLGSGFIWFGISYMMTVLIFIGTFYRPRALLFGLATVTIIAGISFFVSYMQHRDALREATWSGGGMEQRLETFKAMLADTTVFDPTNPDHLWPLTGRLNQNELVGAAVSYVPRFKEYADGKTIYFAVIALIPRAIWPDKPITSGSMGMVTDYTGITFGESTSVGMGQVMEFYINFGPIGVCVGYLLFGALLRSIDMRAGISLLRADWPRFVLWFMIGAAMLAPLNQLLEVTSSMAAAFVLGFLVNKVLERMSAAPVVAAQRRSG